MASHRANRETFFVCCAVWDLSRILPLLFKSPQQVGHKIFKFSFLYQFR